MPPHPVHSSPGVLRWFVLSLLFWLGHSPLSALEIGDAVTSTQETNVRNAPGGTQTGKRAIGDSGTIVAGPVGAFLSSTYYTWWQINWDTGVDGWCFEGGIALAFDPDATLVYGIDVSRWQSAINWPSVYSEGKRFAFAKATQGISTVDVQFNNNAVNGRAAGVAMGFYHYATPLDNPAIEEARHFVRTIRPQLLEGNLLPVLDLESGDSLGATALSAWARAFLAEVKRLTLVRPAIYLNRNFANNYMSADIAAYPLWIAVPGFTPGATVSPLGPWPAWTFQQYSWTGRLAGIGTSSVDTDLNAFRGTLADLAPYRIPAISQSIASTAVSPGIAEPGSRVTLTLACEATHARPVLIGASLFPARAGTEGLSDPPHEGAVNLSAGSSAVSRVFDLPADMSPGVWDLWTALYLDVNLDGKVDSGDVALTPLHKQSGALEVRPAASYAQWATDAGLSGEAAGELADPDGDGSPNLLEYAFATVPDAAESSADVRTGWNAGGQWTFQFDRPSGRPDLLWTVEFSPDLAGWQSIAEAIGDTPFDVLGVTEADAQVTVIADPAGTSAGFYRLQVTRALPEP